PITTTSTAGSKARISSTTRPTDSSSLRAGTIATVRAAVADTTDGCGAGCVSGDDTQAILVSDRASLVLDPLALCKGCASARLHRLRLPLPVHDRRRRALVPEPERAPRRARARGHLSDVEAVANGRVAGGSGRPRRRR